MFWKVRATRGAARDLEIGHALEQEQAAAPCGRRGSVAPEAVSASTRRARIGSPRLSAMRPLVGL